MIARRESPRKISSRIFEALPFLCSKGLYISSRKEELKKERRRIEKLKN
jgi:hypothetical protein